MMTPLHLSFYELNVTVKANFEVKYTLLITAAAWYYTINTVRTVTCDSSEGSGRCACPSWVSGAHSQVINCAARHRELKVSPGEPVRRELYQSMWVVFDSTRDLRQILDIRAVDAVPGCEGPVMLVDPLHPDIQSSRRTRNWGGKRGLLTEWAQIHCLALVLQVLWTRILSAQLEITGKKQTIDWDWLFPH